MRSTNRRISSKTAGVSPSSPTMKQPHTLTPRLWILSIASR